MIWIKKRTVACITLAVMFAPIGLPVQAQGSAPGSALTASAAQGWRILFDQRLGNCVACHSIPNHQGVKSGIQSTFAPALDGVASRLEADMLRQWLVDARAINPDTLMPPFGLILSADQIEDTLAALQTLR